MVSWLVIIVGGAIVVAFAANMRRNPRPGSWLYVLALVGLVLWVASLVDEAGSVPAASIEDATLVRPSGYQAAPSPF